MRTILLPILFLAVLAPAEAEAYCLTTNRPEPIGWQPALTGCWKEGSTIGWPNAPIGFHVDPRASRKIAFDVFERVTTESFAKWSAVSCETPGALSTDPAPHPSFAVKDLGPATIDLSGCKDGDCVSERLGGGGAIFFQDDAWPHEAGSSTLGLTTVTYRGSRIIGAILEINSFDHDFVEHGPGAGGEVALDYVLTHESGHFLGLAHSDRPDSIMFTTYPSDGDATLQADDRAAICAIRPAAAPSPEKGCGCGVPRSSSASGAFAALAAMLLLSRRRAK